MFRMSIVYRNIMRNNFKSLTPPSSFSKKVKDSRYLYSSYNFG